MKFADAIDAYVTDQWQQGRFTSPATEVAYRHTLERHADILGNQDPHYANRDHVKRTLAHWRNPNTAATCRSHLVSFYDWCMEEGMRKDNPARQTRRPKRKTAQVYRLTRDEAAAMLRVATGLHERRAIYIGLLAGLRNAELRGLRGAHFTRPGFIHVSADIAKGGRERWVPVLPELLPIVEEILDDVGHDEYVLPAQRWRDPGANTIRGDLRTKPFSTQALRTLVMGVAKRAGIKAHIYPHLMRHAFGDHVTRRVGIEFAQALLGHADIATTKTYSGQPTLDELRIAIGDFTYLDQPPRGGTHVQGSAETAHIPLKAPTGIEPVEIAPHAVEPNPADLLHGGPLWHDES